MAGYMSPERKALNNRANIFVILGLVLAFLGRLMIVMAQGGIEASRNPAASTNIPVLLLGAVIAIAGTVCWFIGLSAFARSKGYSSWYALLGLLSCCGLVILVIMPNKWVDGPTQGYGPGDYPRPNG